MARVPFKCDNVQCRFHTDENKKGCLYNDTIHIDSKGCENFEKGYIYYINLVWNLLQNNKDIPFSILTRESCVGIYLVMVLFDLELEEKEIDGKTYYNLIDKYEYPQDYNSIITKQINFDVLNKILSFEKKAEISNMPEIQKYTYQNIKGLLDKGKAQFGWLSPLADFYPGEYGHHILLGRHIIDENPVLRKEYEGWRAERLKHYMPWDTSTFLLEKGFILIDRPDPSDPISVTDGIRVTRKQKDFLYEYFATLGDFRRARTFMEGQND